MSISTCLRKTFRAFETHPWVTYNILKNDILRRIWQIKIEENRFIYDSMGSVPVIPPLLMDLGDREGIIEAIRSRFQESLSEAVQDAGDICSHFFRILGLGRRYFGESIHWHLDIETGKIWEFDFPWKIDFRDSSVPSDVRNTWEINRFQHFVTLGKAYWYTQDETFAREFIEQFLSWSEANPIGRGVNWAVAMEAAIRAVNWIWAYDFFYHSPSFTENRKQRFLKVLFAHGLFIESNIEYGRVRGNHYLADGAGLVHLGLFFKDSREGRRWLKKGLGIVWESMKYQILDDGVDFEKSTGYQRLVIDLFTAVILLCLKNRIPLLKGVWRKYESMLEFVMYYSRDASSPLIGDSDDGRLWTFNRQNPHDHRSCLSTGAVLFGRADFKAASGGFSEESFWLLGIEGMRKFEEIPKRPLSLKSKAFPIGGFYISRDSNSHLIVDCGELGLAGKGGHGHNDTLSFELFAYGKTWVTDSGTYCYTCSEAWRNHFRSTASHNTVMVDGEEMADFRDLWTVRDRTDPKVNQWKTSEELDFFDGEHYGYRRFSSPVTHRRMVEFYKKDKYWKITDILTGEGEHHFDLFFHLVPMDVCERCDLIVEGKMDGMLIRFIPQNIDGLKLDIMDGWVSPRYGAKVKAPVIRYWKSEPCPCIFETIVRVGSMHEAGFEERKGSRTRSGSPCRCR